MMRKKFRPLKAKPSAHQKLMRFFTVFFVTTTAVVFAGLLYLINR